MNPPPTESGVSLLRLELECQLPAVLFSLVCDIGDNFLFGKADTADTVSSRPDAVSTIEHVFEKRKFRLEQRTGMAFDILDDVGNWHSWWNDDDQVDVIGLRVDFDHLDIGIEPDSVNIIRGQVVVSFVVAKH